MGKLKYQRYRFILLGDFFFIFFLFVSFSRHFLVGFFSNSNCGFLQLILNCLKFSLIYCSNAYPRIHVYFTRILTCWFQNNDRPTFQQKSRRKIYFFFFLELSIVGICLWRTDFGYSVDNIMISRIITRFYKCKQKKNFTQNPRK